MSYPGHSLGRSYPSSEMQLLYSAAPVDWALPLQVRVDPEVMAMKGDSTIPKAPGLNTCHQKVSCHIQDAHLGGSCLFADMQLVYSIVAANSAGKPAGSN